MAEMRRIYDKLEDLQNSVTMLINQKGSVPVEGSSAAHTADDAQAAVAGFASPTPKAPPGPGVRSATGGSGGKRVRR
jgi:hypothetical protein